MELLPEIVPINCYNVEKGKLCASVRWLIGRVYGKSAPDLLQNPLRINENNTFHLEPAVITALTNGTLYCSAAAKIFKDQSLLNKSHGVVLRKLSAQSIPISVSGEEANINELILSSTQPFNQAAHLALIDALMIAHMRSVISIERVINAILNYTTVDKREEPFDNVDALLFWINKICSLVRDDVERSQSIIKKSNSSQVTVPEMDDLYEDMCDGACICAVVAFYRQNELKLEDICFNDPMSFADCQYNLMLLKKFCSTLPSDPFYFEIEDILYLHECLQPNLNAFLTDLFVNFEGIDSNPLSPTDPSPSLRRFTPIVPIPDLRIHNGSARAYRKFKYPQSDMIRAVSVMSTDSLMSHRSANELAKIAKLRNQALLNQEGTTNFSELGNDNGQSNLSNLSNLSVNQPSGGIYVRSDSLPTASIRLALEEKRREHEKKRFFQTNLNQTERVQKQKDAFFTLMQRLEKQNNESRSRVPSEYGSQGSPSARELRSLRETVQGLQKQLQEMSIQQEHLTRQVDGQRQMAHAISQPSIHSDIVYQQDLMQRSMVNPYATLPQNVARTNVQQSQHAYALPFANATSVETIPISGQPLYHSPGAPPQMFHMNSMQQVSPSQMTFAPGSPYMSNVSAAELSQMLNQMDQNTIASQQLLSKSMLPISTGSYVVNPDESECNSGSTTFRLHQTNASSSRLDPSLELNRNLTNWGLTYKAGHNLRPQRRTWENETFIKSEMDLVNQPYVVPQVSPQEQKQQLISASGVTFQRESPVQGSISQQNDFRDNIEGLKNDRRSVSVGKGNMENRPPVPPHHTPPKDPTSPIANVLVAQRQSTAGGSQFIVQDADSDKSAVGVTREMEIKKEALLAKTLRRREQIEQKVEEIEAKNAERRLAELEKQEAAEQRKKERELQRQKILEDYKRKKMEKDLEMNDSAQNSRGHSQPPLNSRTKSTMEVIRSRTNQRPFRSITSFDDSSAPSSARITVPSTAEPTLKLFSKYVHKSNRSMIINALQYSVFPGIVWDKQRNEVLGELAKSDSKHLLLLFRDQKCRYLGAYSWDQNSDTVHRIHGKGPIVCGETMMNIMFKYDSGAKTFSQIPTKHLSATIDGFSLLDQYIQAPKIPHSGNRWA